MSGADELLGPRAWGAACGTAVLKAVPEHFRVTEVVDIELDGTGEHLWLHLLKRDLNTEEVARRLARASGVSLRDVSYAGLKDRRAVTSQWFSIQLPGRPDPDFASLWSEDLHCLERVRHRRKLQRGAHSANRFAIVLSQLVAERDALEERLGRIAAEGVPNYIGPQRFGRNGSNVFDARSWAERGALPPARGTRSRLLSTARSLLFNRVLAQRVADGSWNHILEDDCVAFTDSRSHFPASRLAADDPRSLALDIHPTGPLWGLGEPSVGPTLAALERDAAQSEAALAAWLEHAGLEQARRTLRLPIDALAWHYPSPTSIELEFTLPTGCFATAVIRELVELTDEPGGGLESES
ncbi:tRNA pseudouridine13 synthase [Halopseudomonas xinjiangensis]|uniref:tRNA pseudouridine synthase D n=1 Tax=Halopseudomonas xinjiangensis TaxID=487184 RepID=A0A1H1MZ05_9GAMM|nr:tRNA pseudouridine(13) synthase TruD [Halopseudomonas xinjiangensis]SDR91994.1 tRNA pseudouridine13 synthase [Halopseudomonas xinjiangensis]